MTPQQRHERAIYMLKKFRAAGVPEDSCFIRAWERINDEAVAAFYGLTVEQLETNIQVCWR